MLAPNQSFQQPIVSTHPMITRSKAGISRKHALLITSEPQSVQEALSILEWRNAMIEEYSTLMNNHTWSLVPLPSHRTAIGCR